MNEIPKELKNATNQYADALQKYDLLTRLKILTSLITSEIARKDPGIRDILAIYVIVGMMMVLKRMELIQKVAKKSVADLLGDLEQVRRTKEFLN